MRYTKRDENGNAQLNEGVRLMDALNRLAQLEDWWDVMIHGELESDHFGIYLNKEDVLSAFNSWLDSREEKR